MRLETLDENSYILHGKLKELEDYFELKRLLLKHKEKQQKEINFYIPTAREINFYILGLFLKLARYDGFSFSFSLGSLNLYESFLRLGLHSFFKVAYEDLE
ncbi:hypothetical protein [Helicobacter burdigaliensis]|uniref:hypothetical protein n=1 Tax=Helicobacter burdigaliensis TaxID=2315334 RepID=UPI000EF727AA|nr:hypothetical protein [Helicobacter burdigaliensis]